jgi:membrane protease YdiL (CAAX protease family)
MSVSRAIVPLLFTLIAALQDPIYEALQFKTLVPLESWAVFFFLYGVVAPMLVMAVLDGGLARIIDELGLTKPGLPALLFGFFVTLPAFLGFLTTGKVSNALAPREIVMGGLFFPFVEEAFFRGFLFGQLYGRAGWGFWPAALVPAVVFALGHLYQSQDPMELAGILAITGTGAILFSYVFMQWGANIWAPFACHAFLNIWWSVFAVDDTALGDQAANTFRLASIALALGFCFIAPRFGWLTPLARATSRPSAH